MSTGPLSRIGSLPAADREHDDRAAGTGVEQVTATTIEVYRYVAGRGGIGSLEAVAVDLSMPMPQVISAITRLVELHLLRTDGPVGDRLVPVDPGVATSLLVAPLERAMYQHRELTDQLRARIDAIVEPTVGSIDHVAGTVEIRGLVKLAGDVCRQELAVLRPAGDDDLLDELLDPCYQVLDREVAVRVVCPHRTRADFAARAKAGRLINAGAELRTLSQIPQAAIVFDRRLAVIIALPDGDDAPTARRVSDRDVVGFLSDLFDQMWDGATPFASVEPGYAAAVDDLQRSVARLMAEGLTDEAVARRLGMSVRTCRRHIAALLQNLNSVSRFQAGVQAAQRLAFSTVTA